VAASSSFKDPEVVNELKALLEDEDQEISEIDRKAVSLLKE